MDASGVRVDNRPEGGVVVVPATKSGGLLVELRGNGIGKLLPPAVGGTAAGLLAVTLIPGAILFCARIISGRLFPRAATCRTAWVTEGSRGQGLMLKTLQSPTEGSLRSACMLPKSMSPAQAAPAPHNHRAAPAPARREMVEDLIDARINAAPF